MPRAKIPQELARAFSRSKLLGRKFYERNTHEVARELLGKIIAVKSQGRWVAGRIIETEAYRKDDPACHAFRRRTVRNEVMFGKPGTVYVYLIYGMYEMLNLVTEPEGEPAAVLIRALEPVLGAEIMQKRRPEARKPLDISNGPGRLAGALGVRLGHKGESAIGPTYYVLDDGYKVAKTACSPRVGIKVGAELEWRYFISGHPYVSKAPQNKLSREHTG